MIRFPSATAVLLPFVLGFLSLAACSPALAAVVYQVTVDTSAINGVNGNLNFQFNPGGGDSQAATATVSAFATTGGLFGGAPTVTGDVTGTLPAAVTLGNSTGFNDYFHPFLFGSSFQFLLTFDGPAITAPNGTATAGSTFGLGLFNEIGDTALLTTDPFGFAALVEVALDGSTAPIAFPAAAGSASAVTFGDASAIPEPATALTMAASILALGVYARGRRRKSN